MAIDTPIVASLRIGSPLNGTQGAKHVGDEEEVDWIIKPFHREIDKGAGKSKGTVNEYLAAKLSELISLPVPEHKPLYLPSILIDTYPSELAGFEAGYVLGSRYEGGFDLSIVRKRPGLMTTLKSGLTNYDNHFNAVGIMVGDTWIANADRCAGQLYSFHNNEGNLYFTSVEGANNLWAVRAIDFGHAFLGMRWGDSSISPWPTVLLGTMRFFYEMNWFDSNLSEQRSNIDVWLDRISSLDILNELQSIISSMPAEWLSDSGMVVSPISPATVDWTDLGRRLIAHKGQLSTIIASEYATVASKY